MKGDIDLIHNTVKNVMLADFIFTFPGLILIIFTGINMVIQAGYSLSSFNWLTLSLMLYVFIGVLWLGILIPLQYRMIRYSNPSIGDGSINQSYKKASNYWAIFGMITTIIPVLIFYFMITKGF
ncbi:DUF2269 family protein [Bacillus solimangrovi]|uniref:DUF2269 family protein n=1 Tax=Bacillus solimangrovi TaxID=1305675 RepID=UPI00268B5D29